MRATRNNPDSVSLHRRSGGGSGLRRCDLSILRRFSPGVLSGRYETGVEKALATVNIDARWRYV